MKPEFSSYGYPGAPPSHLHPPYSPLSPLPVKSDLLTQSYQQYAAASQFGELIYIYRRIEGDLMYINRLAFKIKILK